MRAAALQLPAHLGNRLLAGDLTGRATIHAVSDDRDELPPLTRADMKGVLVKRPDPAGMAAAAELDSGMIISHQGASRHDGQYIRLPASKMVALLCCPGCQPPPATQPRQRPRYSNGSAPRARNSTPS